MRKMEKVTRLCANYVASSWHTRTQREQCEITFWASILLLNLRLLQVRARLAWLIMPLPADDVTQIDPITQLITNMMIAGDMLPLNFVEGKGFRELMEFVEPE